jgi:predicted acetyltransferase
MTVSLREARASTADRAWIRAVYADYVAGLSGARSGIFPALEGWSVREDDLVSAWFRDPAAQPFVILADGVRTGFALVGIPSGSGSGPHFRMIEFFVAPAARRRGVGAHAAALLFARFPGEWEILENEDNRAALAFWRRVIAEHTGGRYRETRAAGEVRQRFLSAARTADRAG